MAVCSFRKVMLALVSNLGAPVICYSGGFNPQSSGSTSGSGTDTRAGQGQVRIYGPGRARNVVAAGMTRSFAMYLEGLTMAQAQTLESWINQTVLYRDSQGRKFYGVFNDVAVADWKNGGDTHEVKLTVIEVTYSESV